MSCQLHEVVPTKAILPSMMLSSMDVVYHLKPARAVAMLDVIEALVSVLTTSVTLTTIVVITPKKQDAVSLATPIWQK